MKTPCLHGVFGTFSPAVGGGVETHNDLQPARIRVDPAAGRLTEIT